MDADSTDVEDLSGEFDDADEAMCATSRAARASIGCLNHMLCDVRKLDTTLCHPIHPHDFIPMSLILIVK